MTVAIIVFVMAVEIVIMVNKVEDVRNALFLLAPSMEPAFV
jgi:hypothetical protein